MPPIKRKHLVSRRPNLETLTHDIEWELIHGSPPFARDSGAFQGDVDLFREAWKIHGAAILREFIEENPGRRPFGWWLIDHGIERPIINPFLDQCIIDCYRAKTYGFLDTGIIGGPKFERFQEDETDYLQRLGLLEPGEYERYLAAEADDES